MAERKLQKIAAHYEAIRVDYENTLLDLRRDEHYLNLLILDNMKAEQAHLLVDYFGIQWFEERIRDLKARSRNLYSMLPCADFAKRFGWLFHELYKERYPIYAGTRVIDVPWLPADHRSYTYIANEQVDLSLYMSEMTVPPVAARRQYTVPIELWAETTSSRRYRLAYANEVDAVMVFPLSP
jgi:hypothetical protein